MADFRANRVRYEELMEHIKSREGLVNHFYCDDNIGLVTFGYGQIVDRRLPTLAARRQFAEAWLNRNRNVRFYHKITNRLATTAQVLEDWDRAQNYFVRNGATPSNNYNRVTHLRIRSESADIYLYERVRAFADDLYRRRPYMLYYDERLAMAIVDVRYNSARVGLYDMQDDEHDLFHANIPRMWRALDPLSPNWNLDHALRYFRDTWATRGSTRYQHRHRLRVAMFSAGIEKMKIDLRSGIINPFDPWPGRKLSELIDPWDT